MSQAQPVVFITGGSRGIGEALIQNFSDAGWKVASCSRTEIYSQKLDFGFPCDLEDPEQARKSVGRVIERFGRLDCVINNAGMAGTNPLEPGSSDELWDRILAVNLTATYLVSKAALPHLPNETGRIINIASVLGLKGVPDATAYCAAKHGVVGFTKALAHHLASRKITVNAICPGWVRTEMAESRRRELNISEERLVAGVPLKRFIEPEEIAKTALFLASDAAAMITGQALTIDGGVLA